MLRAPAECQTCKPAPWDRGLTSRPALSSRPEGMLAPVDMWTTPVDNGPLLASRSRSTRARLRAKEVDGADDPPPPGAAPLSSWERCPNPRRGSRLVGTVLSVSCRAMRTHRSAGGHP